MELEKLSPPNLDEPPPYPGSPPYPSQSPPVSPPLPPSVPHYAEADIVSLQGVSGNNTYAVPALASSSPGADASPLPELPRHYLIFKEKLGEGQFGEVRDGDPEGGEAGRVCACSVCQGASGTKACLLCRPLPKKTKQVHLCEIESPQDLPNLEFPFNVRKGRPLLVAVKILRPDASKNARCAAAEAAFTPVCRIFLHFLLFRSLLFFLMSTLVFIQPLRYLGHCHASAMDFLGSNPFPDSWKENKRYFRYVPYGRNGGKHSTY